MSDPLESEPGIDSESSAAAVKLQKVVLDALPAHIALIDSKGVILTVNDSWPTFAAEKGLAGSGSGVGQNYLEVCDQATGDFSEQARAAAQGIRQVLRGEVKKFEIEYRCPSPTEARWFRLMATPLRDGAVVMHINVTDRKLAEARIHRLNRLYAVSSGINEAIVRIQNTQELYEQACRIAVERGGLTMAWVGVADVEGGRLRPVAQWGRDEGYLKMIEVNTTPDKLPGKGPGGRAFRAGKPACCNDIAADTDSFASKVEALERGYQSCAAFPLKTEASTFGVLAVYGSVPGFFGEEEMQLLNALAENLSFAVESHQREQQRQRTEQALRASEANMADAQRIANFGSWELDLSDPSDINANPLRWSDEMFRIAGYEPGAITVTNELFFSLVPSEDHEAIRLAVDAAIRERRHYQIVHRLRRPDGEERIVRETAQIFFDALTGKPSKMVGTAHDISEQKRAEMEIQRTTDLLRAVADGTPDAVYVKDLQGRYLLFNEGAARLVGRPIEEVLGQDDLFLFGADGAQIVLESDQQVKESGQSLTREEILTSAGVTRTYLATKAPHRDRCGTVVGIIGISRDITASKQAEGKLREQAELLDRAQDAILVRDLDHRILYWNRSAERLYGWSASEVIGRSVRELLYRETADFLPAVEATITQGEWMGELEQRTKGGKSLTVEARWTLVRDDQGRPKSILAINTDITERKKLEQQFLRAQRMESIGTLAGGIAHDLNNVLAPIMMSIDLLKLQERDPVRLSILSTIEGSAKRGANMVQQVLSFARGVEGQQLDVQIRQVLHEIEKITNETFLKNIQVISNIQQDLWIIQGDPTQLHQVLLNLCVNARDAMPRGGTLTLSANNMMVDEHYAGMEMEANPGPHVVIQVEDTGTGMPPEVIDRIFEPFFTTKELGQGTGLGLSTTIAIVKSHGGFIRVYSEMGAGTKFRVYLPARGTTGRGVEIPLQTEMPRGHGELILVIDDEASVRQITKQTLEAFGYEVLLASDGAEATSIYAAHKKNIDVVLTDMMMPVMDGPATIHVLMRMNPRVRIIAASGLNANGMAAKAISAGVKYFLPKPYTAQTLLQTLGQVLEARTERFSN